MKEGAKKASWLIERSSQSKTKILPIGYHTTVFGCEADCGHAMKVMILTSYLYVVMLSMVIALKE